MGFESLNFHMLQSSCRQNAAGQFQRILERSLPTQLVNGRPPYHALNRSLAPRWLQHQRVAVLQPRHVSADAVQQQVVGVDFFDQLFAAINASRPATSRAR